MLVLTRKLGQQIRIGDDITLTIVKTQGNTVRIGIEAPKQIRVLRAELPPRENASERPTLDSVSSRPLRSTATLSRVQTDDRRQQVATSTQEPAPGAGCSS